MKITRRQLRQLISESMIKPGIPNIPSDNAMTKIDVMARSEDLQPDADSIAGTFGYPEDRSYVDDLRTYDDSGRLGPAIDQMRALGTKYADAETHGEPEAYYFRRSAIRKAAEICDSFDMSMVKPLIDSFTDAANDYEKNRLHYYGRQDQAFEHEAYDIAGQIYLRSDKPYQRKENYSNLYDDTSAI